MNSDSADSARQMNSSLLVIREPIHNLRSELQSLLKIKAKRILPQAQAIPEAMDPGQKLLQEVRQVNCLAMLATLMVGGLAQIKNGDEDSVEF